MKKFLVCLLVIAGLWACGSVPITGRKQINLVSDQEVLTLSLQSYGDYMKTAKKSTDKTATALVVKVGQKIASAVEAYYKANGMEAQLANYAWEFNLVEDEAVNAFCMPGGKIVVYTGILPVTRDETGLAVVLGHEVGHAIAKHSNERMSHQILQQTGGAALGVALGGATAETQALANAVYGLGTELGVMLPFNRKQELEADHLGLVLMAIAGYDASQAIPFWERMAANGGGNLEILSTHPSDSRRIADIKKALPEAMEYYNAIWGTGAKPASAQPGATTKPAWTF
jgi:predicted Zn-dependent protease